MLAKRILFINTGGTISSSAGKQGFTPTFTACRLLDEVPELQTLGEIQSMDLMSLDSTNLQPSHWAVIARTVNEALDNFDGVVIAHGTDTMAYTASALSFMLGSITKPVVLTGAQSPIGMIEGDSKMNLRDAFRTAFMPLSGVYIVFGGKVILGCRASKVRSLSNDSFESINYPYIGFIEEGEFRSLTVQENNSVDGHVYNCNFRNEVLLLRLIPGAKPEILTIARSMGYKGIVIEGFGLGGIPFHDNSFIPIIKELRRDGISVAVTTQCLYEGSNLTVYEVGRHAMEAGVIPCYDMTTEAIVAKLMWALGQTDDPSQVERMMRTNYTNEIILPETQGVRMKAENLLGY